MLVPGGEVAVAISQMIVFSRDLPRLGLTYSNSPGLAEIVSSHIPLTDEPSFRATFYLRRSRSGVCRWCCTPPEVDSQTSETVTDPHIVSAQCHFAGGHLPSFHALSRVERSSNCPRSSKAVISRFPP